MCEAPTDMKNPAALTDSTNSEGKFEARKPITTNLENLVAVLVRLENGVHEEVTAEDKAEVAAAFELVFRGAMLLTVDSSTPVEVAQDCVKQIVQAMPWPAEAAGMEGLVVNMNTLSLLSEIHSDFHETELEKEKLAKLQKMASHKAIKDALGALQSAEAKLRLTEAAFVAASNDNRAFELLSCAFGLSTKHEAQMCKQKAEEAKRVAENAVQNKAELNEKTAEVEATKAEVEATKAELNEKNAEVEATKAELTAQQAAQEAELEAKAAEFAAQKTAHEAQKSQLAGIQASLKQMFSLIDVKMLEE